MMVRGENGALILNELEELVILSKSTSVKDLIERTFNEDTPNEIYKIFEDVHHEVISTDYEKGFNEKEVVFALRRFEPPLYIKLNYYDLRDGAEVDPTLIYEVKAKTRSFVVYE